MCGRRSILAGSLAGRQLFAALVAKVQPVKEPLPCFLDFRGIDVATISFLRESVFAFRNFIMTRSHGNCPVIANANATVQEEIEIFLLSNNDALWICDLTDDEQVQNPQVIGNLDPAQRETFHLVVKRGQIDAPTLAKERTADSIGSTAWNNRLAGLVAKGLLVELRTGKSKTYRPVLEMR